MPSHRVSPPHIFPTATRSGKPPRDAEGSVDSHRQAGFVLGIEIDHIIAGLNLEGACAQAAAGPKFRKQVVAATLVLWSRSWLSRLQALHAAEWGNTTASIPLVRSAADYEAAGRLTLQTGGAEWQEWLETDPIGLAAADHATQYQLHAFRAAEVLAARPVLGEVYRTATALSLPHFEASLLLAAAESNSERIVATFGDRDFHLGMVELVCGWLLALGVEQFEAIIASDGALPVPDAAAVESWMTHARKLIDRDDRCRIELVERDGAQHMLVANWRRRPGAARKKILI